MRSTRQQSRRTTPLLNGEITTMEEIMAEHISLEEVQAIVDEMVKMGFIAVSYGHDGVERYQITELGRLELRLQED